MASFLRRHLLALGFKEEKLGSWKDGYLSPSEKIYVIILEKQVSIIRITGIKASSHHAKTRSHEKALKKIRELIIAEVMNS